MTQICVLGPNDFSITSSIITPSSPTGTTGETDINYSIAGAVTGVFIIFIIMVIMTGVAFLKVFISRRRKRKNFLRMQRDIFAR